MTLQDDPGTRRARPVAAAPAEAEAGSVPESVAIPADAGRHRYAVGVFANPAVAHTAIAALASEGCEVLAVSATPWHDTPISCARDGRVTFRQIDGSGTLAGSLSALLGEPGPFVALGASVAHTPAEAPAAPGQQRLFHSLVHHLGAGAAVVIVRASGAEQHLNVSRALLEARCDILLTHDVLPPIDRPHSADGDDPEACCRSCSSRSCGRMDTSTPPVPTR